MDKEFAGAGGVIDDILRIRITDSIGLPAKKPVAGCRAAEIDVGMGRNRLVGSASASDELNQMPLCLQVGYQQRVCCFRKIDCCLLYTSRCV